MAKRKPRKPPLVAWLRVPPGQADAQRLVQVSADDIAEDTRGAFRYVPHPRTPPMFVSVNGWPIGPEMRVRYLFHTLTSRWYVEATIGGETTHWHARESVGPAILSRLAQERGAIEARRRNKPSTGRPKGRPPKEAKAARLRDVMEGRLSDKELANKWDVTETTIRRDRTDIRREKTRNCGEIRATHLRHKSS